MSSRVSLITTVACFSLGAGIVATVTPLFAGSVGGSHLEVGVLGLFYGLAYVLSALPAGYLSDRFGTKTLILCGMVVTVASHLTYSMTQTIPQLAVARVLEGAGWATWWTSLESLVTHMGGGHTARLMGLVSTIYGMGFFGGSLLAGFLSAGIGFGATFRTSLLISTFSTLFCALMLKGVPVKPKVSMEEVHGDEEVEVKEHRSFVLVPYVVAICYSFVLSATIVLFPLYGYLMFSSEVLVGTLMAVLWLGRVIAFMLAGIVSDAAGRIPVMVTAICITILSSLAVPFVGGYVSLLLVVLVLGIGLGCVFPLCIAMISESVPKEKRGSATGFFESMVGIGSVLGPVGGGLVAQQISPGSTYWLNSIIMLPALTFLLWKIMRRRAAVAGVTPVGEKN